MTNYPWQQSGPMVTGNAKAVTLTSVDNIAPNQGIKCLVYAHAGAGKTRLIATAPRPVIIAAERGLLSLAGTNIPVLPPVNSLDDLKNIKAWLLQSNEAKQFDTICIDSLSEIAEQILSKAKAANKDGRMAYGDTADEVYKLFREFVNLAGKHVYFICKMEYDKDGATGAMMWRPMFPGNKVAQAAPYFVDEVFQLNVVRNPNTQQMERWLRTQPDPFNQAKDRSGKLAEWEPANLTHVFSKILGKAA